MTAPWKDLTGNCSVMGAALSEMESVSLVTPRLHTMWESNPGASSAQKAEVMALTRALELSTAELVHIWTDGKDSFGVTQAHGAI